MSRFFSFSYRPCCGPTGGSGGVNWRLREANNTFALVDRMHNLFLDVDLNGDAQQAGALAAKPHRSADKVKRYLKRLPAVKLATLNRKLSKAQGWFQSLHDRYRFTADDVLVFHDCESAYAFAMSGIKTANAHWVYHQQGSLYSEAAAIDGVRSESLQRRYQEVFAASVDAVGDLRFPSLGARSGLIATDPTSEQLVLSHSAGEPLYNGFTLTDQKRWQEPSATTSQVLRTLEQFDGITFVTVANLNYAKAVERIPPVIAKARKLSSRDVMWVIVGDGIRGDEVSRHIDAAGLADCVIWIREFVGHDDILRLLLASDIYVLLQRVSIFDYATLEAMACGNALLLSPVGGNLEVLEDGQNGFFINPDSPEENVLSKHLLNPSKLEDLKRKSISLEESRFSDYKFLERYASLANR